MVSFYTPTNLRGNYLSNLKPQTQNTNLQPNALNISPEQLMAIYNKDLARNPPYGQSPGDTPGTGGDPNQGAGVESPAAQMSTQDIADDIGQLDAVSIFGGILPDPVGVLFGAKNDLRSRALEKELQRRNGLMAPEDEVSPTEFSFDPNMTAHQIADQNKDMQRSVTGTDQGISRNDPNPAPSGDAGEGQGSTVICTELHRQGYLSDEIYEADKEFGGTLSYEVLRGYHRWALPWVRVMKASTLATRLTWLVARPWSQHMAFKMGFGEMDGFIGRPVMEFGRPLCRLCSPRKKPHPHPSVYG